MMGRWPSEVYSVNSKTWSLRKDYSFQVCLGSLGFVHVTDDK